MPSQQNFYLWGSWGSRVAKTPFLTQKVDSRVRKVCIGADFLLALRDDGLMVSWGEDKNGCLGLGKDKLKTTEPITIEVIRINGLVTVVDKEGDFKAENGKVGVVIAKSTTEGQWMVELRDGSDKRLDVPHAKLKVDPRDVLRMVDLQLGDQHVLALSEEGKVYAWGQHKHGQLGVGRGTGDLPIEREMWPTLVEKIKGKEDKDDYRVLQIVALKDCSFALTDAGVVYAWGYNDGGKLGLDHVGGSVVKEPRALDFKRHKVLRLERQKDALLGYLDTNFDAKTLCDTKQLLAPLGTVDPTRTERSAESKERELLHGLNLMRKVLDNISKWWQFLQDMKHGSPTPLDVDPTEPKPEEIDASVDIEVLSRALRDLDHLVHTANKQSMEVGQSTGQKNTRRILDLFIMSCELRKEKLRRTIEARQLVEIKRQQPRTLNFAMQELNWTAGKHRAELRAAKQEVTSIEMKAKEPRECSGDARELQDAMVGLCQAKIALLDAQWKLADVSHKSNITYDVKKSPLTALRTIKDRWSVMKHISLYNLYQECDQAKLDELDDDKLMADLVHESDKKINMVVEPGLKEKVVKADAAVGEYSLAPSLCYDLIQENADLRKMCNGYQLKILVHYKGRLGGGGVSSKKK